MKLSIKIMRIIFIMVIALCVLTVLYNIVSFNINSGKLDKIVNENNTIMIERYDQRDSTFSQTYTIVDMDNNKYYKVEKQYIPATINPVAIFTNTCKYKVYELNSSEVEEIVEIYNSELEREEEELLEITRDRLVLYSYRMIYNETRVLVTGNYDLLQKIVE